MWRLGNLPMHPLIVHLPVVAVPLVAAGLALFVACQRHPRHTAPQVLGAGAAVVVIALGATVAVAAAASHRFIRPGTFAYLCTIHPAMTARITVDP